MRKVSTRGIALWGVILSGSLALFASTALALPGPTIGLPMTSSAAAQVVQTAWVQATAKVLQHRKVVRLDISNYSFSPANIVVSPGTKVIWTNQDGDQHTVTVTTLKWTSAALDTGDTYSQVFKSAGSFNYFCKIHPFMHGTVTVRR